MPDSLVYEYIAEIPAGSDLQVHVFEDAFNPAEKSVYLAAPAEPRWHITPLAEKQRGGEVVVKVPVPGLIPFEAKPYLELEYTIYHRPGGSSDFCAVCEFVTNAPVRLQPQVRSDPKVASTISGSTFRIRDTLGSVSTFVQVWIELRKV